MVIYGSFELYIVVVACAFNHVAPVSHPFNFFENLPKYVFKCSNINVHVIK